MDQNQGEPKEEKLPELPPTKSKFWEYADVYNREMQRSGCDHYMEMVDGNAQCKNCGFGIFLDDRDIVKDGHLYRDNELII